MTENKPDQPLEALLAVHQEAYNHVRHVQSMRGMYFNIYIVIIGAALAALLSLDDKGEINFSTSVLMLGIVVWIVSIFSIMRAERWTGHIIHDLITVRLAQNKLRIFFPTIDSVIPNESDPDNAIEFSRRLSDLNRSIETQIIIVTTVASAIGIAFYSGLVLPAQIMLGIILVFVPFFIFQREITHIVARHDHCCIKRLEAYKQLGADTSEAVGDVG